MEKEETPMSAREGKSATCCGDGQLSPFATKTTAIRQRITFRVPILGCGILVDSIAELCLFVEKSIQ